MLGVLSDSCTSSRALGNAEIVLYVCLTYFLPTTSSQHDQWPGVSYYSWFHHSKLRERGGNLDSLAKNVYTYNVNIHPGGE